MKNIKNIKKEIKQIAEKETPQFQSWLQQNNQRVNDQLNVRPFAAQPLQSPIVLQNGQSPAPAC